MKTALITGAGNIGRGFIGQIMYEAGYRVCFLDVVETMVNALNEAGEYPLDIVSSKGVDRKSIPFSSHLRLTGSIHSHGVYASL